jgi:hypothetical protein
MSWINDVREEIRNLDISKKSLRKFGISVGMVLSILSIWMIYKDHVPSLRIYLGVIGVLLIITGVTYPGILKHVYKVWMGLAFAIGWVVSRILLLLLFYLFVVPIGLISHLVGKEFMDIKMNKVKETYWVKKNKKTNYEKMY